MRPLILITLLTLAACGADGPPVAPEQEPETGITVTGEITVGVSTRGD